MEKRDGDDGGGDGKMEKLEEESICQWPGQGLQTRYEERKYLVYRHFHAALPCLQVEEWLYMRGGGTEVRRYVLLDGDRHRAAGQGKSRARAKHSCEKSG